MKWKTEYSEAELLRATLKLYTKSLHTPTKAFCHAQDEASLYSFAVDTTKNLRKLNQRIESGFEFKPGTLKKIKVNGKEKSLYIFPWDERIVDTMLYHIVSKKFNKVFSSSSYAYKTQNAGVDICQGDIARYLKRKKPLYVIKRDISSYFPSIDKTILTEKLKEVILDPELFDLLLQRVFFSYYENEELIASDKGIPFGTPIACFFANLYLHNMDKLFDSDPEIGYFRYADDFLIVTDSREQALEIIEKFDKECLNLNLTCKPSHTRDLVFAEDKIDDAEFEYVSRFKHLGLEFRANDKIGLSRDKVRKILNLVKRRMKQRRKKWKKLPQDEYISKVVDLANKALTDGLKNVAIVDYYLKHVTDEDQLKIIDRYVAEIILSVVLERGYKKSNFKLIPYKKLRSLGLISLVHRRRLLHHGHLESSFSQMRHKEREERFLERRSRWKIAAAHRIKNKTNS